MGSTKPGKKNEKYPLQSSKVTYAHCASSGEMGFGGGVRAGTLFFFFFFFVGGGGGAGLQAGTLTFSCY